jgi:hypothetical protein
VLDWLRAAAQQVTAVDNVLMANYQVSRAQLDGLWAYVRNKGEKTIIPKRITADSFGARPYWTSIPGCASRAALPKRKPRPRRWPSRS